MEEKTIEIERVFNAPVQLVWKAITEKKLMGQWYFELNDFKPEKGFEFQFYGQGLKGEEYLHLCKIMEVEPFKKLKHSWTYKGHEGFSIVTFELYEQGPNRTKLKLTHTGLETFPLNNPDFVRGNFINGWEYIINTALKDFLESNYNSGVVVSTDKEKAYIALTECISDWWTEDFTGSSTKINDVFIVRFGTTFKTMRVQELIPNVKVVWSCIDTLIDIPELQNNTEWKDTTIVWDLERENPNTKISLTHIGLTPKVDCYEICEKGWESFLESLSQFLKTGKGTPYKK